MKSSYLTITVLILSILGMGCQGSPIEPPSVTPSPPLPAATPTPLEVTLQNEKIMILEPAPGSRAISPLLVSGIADSTFEQTLVVRLLLEDGSQLAFQPTMIRSELGQRGPFELELEFNISGEQQAFIQVFEQSARDGEITHLSSVGITIAENGPAQIHRLEPGPEQITIFQPSVRDHVQGGRAHVRGYGWASFEQTLVIEVQDENGMVVGSMPILVEAPDLGQPGHFSAQVPYQVTSSGPGRILVRDISPAFGGDVHRTSVEIELAP